jgi:hypothetical protein
VTARAVPVIVVCALAFPSLAAATQVAVPCDRPSLFPGAAVNVVVLPYESGSEEPLVSPAAGRMSFLLQMDTLFSAARYGSMGATHVKRTGADCRPARVWRQLVGQEPGAERRLEPGRGLVLFWGRLYETSGQLYVQSNVRFGRGSDPERVTLRVGDQAFVGRLATQAVAFSPTRVSVDDLGRIENAFAETASLRATPEGPVVQRLPVGDPAAAPRGYWVTETRDDWLRLEGMDGQQGGWVPARVAVGGVPLRDRMPELRFVDALAGFLRWRAGDRDRLRDPGATAAEVEKTLLEFEQRGGPRLPSQVRALSLQLRAVMRLGDGDAPGDLAAAHGLLREAADLLPESADARNLEIITRVAAAYRRPDGTFRARATADQLALAVALSRNDRTLVNNLASLYRLLEAPRPPPASPPPPPPLPPPVVRPPGGGSPSPSVRPSPSPSAVPTAAPSPAPSATPIPELDPLPADEVRRRRSVIERLLRTPS